MSKKVLISVSEKTGIVSFAKGLSRAGYEIISTGGTALTLRNEGLSVCDISELTQMPEMLDGRVKTLHPKVHAGLLARRDNMQHMQTLHQHAIACIDMVVVNLYPFEKTVQNADCTLADAIENIDIGGPAMVRSAAKNYQDVAVVTDSNQYAAILEELQHAGALSLTTKLKLSIQAFARIAQYDVAIANYLSSLDVPETLGVSPNQIQPTPSCDLQGKKIDFPVQLGQIWQKVQDLRYGENPHQNAAFYRQMNAPKGALVNAVQLQGKELSYNNIADADAAWSCVKSFQQTACVIVKHANPCGVAIGQTALQAYEKAYQTDPTSAFGGIIAFNQPVDEVLAHALGRQFIEVLIAPLFTKEALTIFKNKPNIRILQCDISDNVFGSSKFESRNQNGQHNNWDLKRVDGGLLVQSVDSHVLQASDLRIVSQKQPTGEQIDDMLFAWKVAQFVKSNAIVYCANGMTLGVGAGQMSRLDSARIASIKAEHAQLSLQASVVASDAFFPFRDGVDVLADAGAACIIQPGGSMRDQEVIDCANERGLVMAFTGVRHFRH